MARLEPFERARFDAARESGKRERPEAYAFDALVDLSEAAVTGVAPGTDESDAKTSNSPRVELVVHVDHTALVRGHTEAGETCEIAGVGPFPVAVAQRFACDAYLKVLVEDATDILAVAHPGRTIPARLKTALEARDQECVIAGCHATRHLETDHNIPVSEGGETSIHNCHRLCPFPHDHKHRSHARLVGTPGQMTFAYPDGPAPPTPTPP